MFFDLFLLALELEELLLCALHLGIDLFRGVAIGFVKFQHGFGWAEFGHGWSRRVRGLALARPHFADINEVLEDCQIFRAPNE